MALPFSDVSAFRRDPLELFVRRAQEHDGPLAPLNLAVSRVFLATDPAVARDVLKADPAFLEKGSLVRKLRAVLGDSLLTRTGADHQRTKDVLHRHLQRNAVAGQLEKMAAIVNAHVATWLRQGSCDSTVNGSLSLRLTCTAVFGDDVIGAADRHALIHAVGTMEGELQAQMFRLLPRSRRSLRAAEARLGLAWQAFRLVVDKARRHEARSPLIRALEASGMSDEEICEELLGLMITGHHTTASVVTWMMYHLATDYAISEVVGAEADAVLESLEAGEAAAFRHAPLSLAFVKEILRLYPSGYWMSREAVAPGEVGGRRLRKGDTVIVSPYQLHRDPRFWQEPDVVDLGRDYTNPAYLPFGVGSRACIGMALAWFQLQLIVIQLSAAVRLRLSETARPAPRPIASVTLGAPEMTFEVGIRSDRFVKTTLAA